MSDQIKTQHGTIGLLMAECEQLRRDLAQAKAENQRLTEERESHAWEVSPAMAQSKIDQLHAENFRLKGELGSVRSGSGKVTKFLRGEIRELKAKLAEIDYLDGEAQQGYAEMRRQLDEAKAENARLAAALAMCKLIAETHKPHAEGCDCLQCVPFERMHDHASEPNNALRDLLAPTIDVIDTMPYCHKCSNVLSIVVTRLRSILTSGAKSDTNTP